MIEIKLKKEHPSKVVDLQVPFDNDWDEFIEANDGKRKFMVPKDKWISIPGMFLQLNRLRKHFDIRDYASKKETEIGKLKVDTGTFEERVMDLVNKKMKYIDVAKATGITKAEVSEIVKKTRGK